jgi:hypothetical protein
MFTRPARSYVGSAALALSGVGLIVGLVALYAAEGPSSPDITSYLAGPSGRSEFFLVPLSLTAAIILLLVGMVTLTFEVRDREPYLASLTNVLAATATAVFIGFLSIQYALVALGAEGTDPSNSAYKLFAVAAHAIADWGGWTGVVLVSCSLLLLGIALLRTRQHRISAIWAIVTAGIGLALIPIGFGFALMLPLALWEWSAAAALMAAKPKPP